MSRANNRNRRRSRRNRRENPLHPYGHHNSNHEEYSSSFDLNQYIYAGVPHKVPITLRHLSKLVDLMLQHFKSPHTDLFTDAKKLVYKKVCFILAEIKWSRSFMFGRMSEHLRDISNDPLFYNRCKDAIVPHPLALYLNSVGRFTNNSISYIPVPAITENHITDACYSCMPYTFTNVLNQLADGVEINKVPEKAQKSLKSLPAIDWEITRNNAGVATHIRLKPESVEFWLKPRLENAPENQLREINCTNDDFCIFSDINFYIAARCSMKVMRVLTRSDEGNASQLVRFEEYDEMISEWYSMHDISDEDKNLGIMFGFGHFEEKVQESIAVGDFVTAHRWGWGPNLNLLIDLVVPIWEEECKRDSDYED